MSVYPSINVLEKVKTFEKRIKDKPREIGIFFNSFGNVTKILKSSLDNPHCLKIKPNTADKVIITHNHPKEIPLSLEDLKYGIEVNAREIRAVRKSGLINILEIPKLNHRQKNYVINVFTKMQEVFQELCRPSYEKLHPPVGTFKTLEESIKNIENLYAKFSAEYQQKAWVNAVKELRNQGLKFKYRTIKL